MNQEEIKQKIMDKLRETEIRYDVKIILAIESGSRGWGFASNDSDYDCRFIYVHRRDYYISVLEKRDIIEYAVDPVFDINGWDLKKAVQHMMKSNGVMHEWLSSSVIYINKEGLREDMRNLADKFFNPKAVSYHYLKMAINKYKEIKGESESKLKKYFYILRPLANIKYIETLHRIPHMEYDKNLAEISVPEQVLAEIQKLKKIKERVEESYKIPPNQVLFDFFESEIQRIDAYLKNMEHKKYKDYEEADRVFRKIIEEAWYE